MSPKQVVLESVLVDGVLAGGVLADGLLGELDGEWDGAELEDDAGALVGAFVAGDRDTCEHTVEPEVVPERLVWCQWYVGATKVFKRMVRQRCTQGAATSEDGEDDAGQHGGLQGSELHTEADDGHTADSFPSFHSAGDSGDDDRPSGPRPASDVIPGASARSSPSAPYSQCSSSS
jgi:hypothetical protein